MNTNDFTSTIEQRFNCNNCNFKCCKLGDWKRHLITHKHNRLSNTNNFTSNNEYIYTCECGKNYKHMSSLCKHKKKCEPKNELGITEKELINILVEQNNKLIKVIENGTNNTNTNTNTNNNTNSNNNTNIDNKTFNLNFFLNETCKDAMNITDFVSSIKVSLEDLENTGRHGYIQGISNIILKKLKTLELHFRPIHCSDAKREVFYIKSNNEWLKENETKPILTKAIKTVANENIKQIQHWRDKHPGCTEAVSNKNNMYLKIVSNSMNGSTEEESNNNINKIISNVAKEVIIDKKPSTT
jgi:hypothetical protein